MKFLDYLKNLSSFNIIKLPNDTGLNLILFYTLIKNKVNFNLTKLIDYIWYMEPKNFYILMYFNTHRFLKEDYE